MSSVTAASSYSDLDARTEFVLNRVAFLESVTDVMQHEDTPENMQKVAVWRDNNYIALIVRSIMDPNEEIYDQAIWATSNILVSEDVKVATMTRAAITDEVLKRLVQLAGSSTLSMPVRNGIHYLFRNLSQYEMPRFFGEAIGGSLLKAVLTDKQTVLSRKAQKDFLDTVRNIAKTDPGAIDDLLLISALFNPDHSPNYSRLFHIIGTLSELQSRISPLGIRQLMPYFVKQLSVDNNTRRRHEMLWVLSNIMTEVTTLELFVAHKDLKNLVESIAWDELATLNGDANETILHEALFVLVNFVAGANLLSEESRKNIANDDDLAALFGACLIHTNAKVAEVAHEGFDLISQLISTFNPDIVCEEFEEACVDVDAIKELSETYCDETQSVESEDAGIEDTETEHAECNVKCCEKPVPSASELVLGARRGTESASVRRVVSLLVNTPVGDWVEVPSDWSLTISDLTTLQHLGYTIKDGHVGINPEIYNTY